MSEPPSTTATREIVGHPRHTGRFWFDFAAASAAIFISIVSLVVAMSGERTQKELLAANSWPFLQVDVTRTGATPGRNASAEIQITNDGVGPAKVESFEVFFDGRPVRTISALFGACCRPVATQAAPPAASVPSDLNDGDVAGNVVRASESLTMLRLPRTTENGARFDLLAASLERISFRACYCSVLDRCWSSDLRTLAPKPVGSCPPVPAFRNDR